MKHPLDATWQKYDAAFDVLLDLLPQELLSCCKRICYAPNDVVVNEGDLLEYIYFIESGVVDGVKRYENGKEFQYFKLDKVNGAIGLLELFSRQRTIIATIVASTKVTMLRVSAAELYACVMEDAALLRKYTYHIAKDLYNDSGKNGQLFYKSGLERVCFYLSEYYLRNRDEQGAVIVRQSYQSIANQIGVSTRTVGRAIRYLQQNELCGHAGKFVRIDPIQHARIQAHI